MNSTSTMNMTLNQNITTATIIITTTTTTKKTLLIQGEEFIHNRFNKVNQNTLLWSTIAIVTIVCLISIFIAIKTFAYVQKKKEKVLNGLLFFNFHSSLRKKRQTRRYKLLSNATTMEEPLFNQYDEEEEEKDDDTLFVRK